MAAEGGFDEETPLISHDDKNTDSYHGEVTVLNGTGGFKPGQASTPNVERIPMQTRQHDSPAGGPLMRKPLSAAGGLLKILLKILKEGGKH